MTIVSNDRRKQYPGNGVSVAFSGPRAFSSDHIKVYLVANATGLATLQTSGYTLTGVGKPSTLVTFSVPPPSSQTVLLLRVVPYEQAADISNQGAYLPETLETGGLDPIVQQTQQLADQVERAMRFAETAALPAGFDAGLPVPVAGSVPVVKADLTGLEWKPGSAADLDLRPDLAADDGAGLVSYKPSGLANAVRVALLAHLSEFVSITNFGAVGDGVNDDGLAVNAAIAAMTERGGGIVWVPEGTFQVNTPIAGASSVVLKGMGAKSKLRLGALSYCFNTTGSLSSDLTNTLASDVAVSSQTVPLAAGKGANFAVGDYCLLTSEAAMPIGSSTNKRGEIVRVQAIASDTITLESPTIFAYAVADTARLRKLTTVNDFAIEDLTIDGNYTANSATFRRSQTVFQWCLRPAVRRVRFRDLGQQAIIFGGCINGVVEGCQFDDLASDDANNFGYALLDCAANVGTRMTNCTGERVRHMYTTTDASTPFAPGYGQPIGSHIADCTALWPRAAGFDTHEMGLDITFSGCKVIGGLRCGFQLRSVRNTVTDCTVTDCVGEAVYVDSSAQDALVSNLRALRTNSGSYLGTSRVDRGAVFDNGLRTRVIDCRIELCGGPAIEGYTGATGFSYERNLIRNPCQLTATNPYAIFANLSALVDVDIHANRITCTDAKTTQGIRASSNNITAYVTGNNVRGVTTPFNFGASVQANGNLPADFVSVGQAQGITIATDAIDVSAVNSGLVSLLGEGGLADNLATINGGVTGQKIQFKRGAAVTITVKNGTGNIQLKGAVDKVLGSSFANVVLRKDGGTWVEDGV